MVTQKKTLENDGYEAVQVGFGDQEAPAVSKPLTGHFKKGDVARRRRSASSVWKTSAP